MVVDLFPLHDGNRWSVRTAPGARKAMVSTEDAANAVQDVLAHLDQQDLTAALFPALESDAPADDDPDLAPVLGLCGPRLLTTEGIAILPPARRFNRECTDRVYRLFAAGRWINGVNGFALAYSDWRPELSVWAYSEGGLQTEGEWGPVADWLVEQVTPLKRYTINVTDPDERTELLTAWVDQATTLWAQIEQDLSSPQPRPNWRPPAAVGVWTHSQHGVVTREETYVQGRRHGPTTRWHLTEDLPTDATDDGDDPFEYRQGHVEREGTYVDGAAHGDFRFFDEAGQLLQEGLYEHGWPHGRWTVHPAATRGLAEPAYVDYEAGVPVKWSIPPLAFDSVQLTQADGASTALAELARGSRGVVLINWADPAVPDLPDRAAQELAELPDLLVLGIHPDTPGSGEFGGRAVRIVADPTAGLARAWGATPDRLGSVTYLDAEGGFLNSSPVKQAHFRHVYRET